jgi:RimJ/RimL family protein N-acetyltransferase
MGGPRATLTPPDAAPESFFTARLSAERLASGHLDGLCLMHRDSRLMATLGGVRPDRDSLHYLVRNLRHWEHYGYGIWVFRDALDGRLVGRAGLRHTLVNGRDEVELAYALLPQFWRRGLASEMGRSLLEIGFRRLALESVVAFTLTSNRRSRAVMERLGLRREGEFVLAGRPHVLYRLHAEAWAGRRAG